MEEAGQVLTESQESTGSGLRYHMQGLRQEFRRIVWPTRVEAMRLSLVILVITFSMAIVVALMDYISAEIILVLDRVF